MELIELLLLLSIVFAAAYIVIVFQTFALARLLSSIGWYGLALGWTILGGLRVWGFIRLPVALMRARETGYVMPQSLTLEQWAQIIIGSTALLLIIVSLDKMRRDFRKKFGV